MALSLSIIQRSRSSPLRYSCKHRRVTVTARSSLEMIAGCSSDDHYSMPLLDQTSVSPCDRIDTAAQTDFAARQTPRQSRLLSSIANDDPRHYHIPLVLLLSLALLPVPLYGRVNVSMITVNRDYDTLSNALPIHENAALLTMFHPHHHHHLLVICTGQLSPSPPAISNRCTRTPDHTHTYTHPPSLTAISKITDEIAPKCRRRTPSVMSPSQGHKTPPHTVIRSPNYVHTLEDFDASLSSIKWTTMHGQKEL